LPDEISDETIIQAENESEKRLQKISQIKENIDKNIEEVINKYKEWYESPGYKDEPIVLIHKKIITEIEETSIIDSPDSLSPMSEIKKRIDYMNELTKTYPQNDKINRFITESLNKVSEIRKKIEEIKNPLFVSTLFELSFEEINNDLKEHVVKPYDEAVKLQNEVNKSISEKIKQLSELNSSDKYNIRVYEELDDSIQGELDSTLTRIKMESMKLNNLLDELPTIPTISKYNSLIEDIVKELNKTKTNFLQNSFTDRYLQYEKTTCDKVSTASYEASIIESRTLEYFSKYVPKLVDDYVNDPSPTKENSVDFMERVTEEANIVADAYPTQINKILEKVKNEISVNPTLGCLQNEYRNVEKILKGRKDIYETQWKDKANSIDFGSILTSSEHQDYTDSLNETSYEQNLFTDTSRSSSWLPVENPSEPNGYSMDMSEPNWMSTEEPPVPSWMSTEDMSEPNWMSTEDMSEPEGLSTEDMSEPNWMSMEETPVPNWMSMEAGPAQSRMPIDSISSSLGTTTIEKLPMPKGFSTQLLPE